MLGVFPTDVALFSQPFFIVFVAGLVVTYLGDKALNAVVARTRAAASQGVIPLDKVTKIVRLRRRLELLWSLAACVAGAFVVFGN